MTVSETLKCACDTVAVPLIYNADNYCSLGLLSSVYIGTS